MPNNYLLLLLIIIVSRSATAAAQTPSSPESLSPRASVSILTCAPGDELYSVFGHTAIRVTDPVQEIDLVFNYGTFDFGTPFFYLKFGHGTLDYILSVTTFRQFMQEYFITGRSVWEQILELPAGDKNWLFSALLENAQPQNRAYRYDFFYDNCATRVRDVVLEPVEEALVVSGQTPPAPATFRRAIRPYLAQKPWIRLGIDLVLGTPADAETDLWSLMFLPDYLMSGFATLELHSAGENRPLVGETTQLLEFNQSAPSGEGLSPMLTLWLLAVVLLFVTLAGYYGVWRALWLNPLLFVTVGLLGVLIGYLSFVSQHVATGHNWNFLWANPLWLLLVTNVNRWWKRLLGWGLLGGMLFLLLFFWSLPQQLPLELIPVWLLLSARLALWLLRK